MFFDPSAEGSLFVLIWMVMMVGVYCYASYCQMKMARKLGLSDIAWWSWVPVLQLFLFVKMAKKPAWWFVLMLVPIVNLIVFIMMSVEIAKNLGQSPFWGVMMLFPVMNFAALGVLAFSGGSKSSAGYQRVPAGAPAGSPPPSSPSHNREHAS